MLVVAVVLLNQEFTDQEDQEAEELVLDMELMEQMVLEAALVVLQVLNHLPLLILDLVEMEL
jgi:hypothetical protein